MKRYILGGFESNDPDKMIDELISQLKSTKPIGLPLGEVWEKLQSRIRNFESIKEPPKLPIVNDE